jgi:predicted negative regulator of RcsB-dependent stress response
MADPALQQKAEEIEEIYADFRAELLLLKKRQEQAIEEFIKTLERRKADKIRKELGLP